MAGPERKELGGSPNALKVDWIPKLRRTDCISVRFDQLGSEDPHTAGSGTLTLLFIWQAFKGRLWCLQRTVRHRSSVDFDHYYRFALFALNQIPRNKGSRRFASFFTVVVLTFTGYPRPNARTDWNADLERIFFVPLVDKIWFNTDLLQER